MLCFLILATSCEQYQVVYHEVLSRVVPGVLKEGQQRQVFTAGPAGRADAEGPEVPSTAAGSGGLFNFVSIHVSLKKPPKTSKLVQRCASL